MPAGVVVDGVSRHYGDVRAVDGASLRVEAGQFVSLLGPSGCGKTTLLRLVGGFEAPDSGRILFGDEDLTGVPPQKRPTAMVFQSYALFPNLSVGENVAYGLRVRKRKRDEVTDLVTAALARVGLQGMEGRSVSELSGGQQQRVALARALVVEPSVILYDEPLSNLDLSLREETRRELKLLQSELGVTSLYVTHDQTEALALSDVIAVMNRGRVVEVGSPQRLYEQPETAFVAGFLGGANLVEDRMLLEQWLPGTAVGEAQLAAIRPTSFRVATEEQAGALPAKLLTRQFLGPYSEWTFQVDGGSGPFTGRMWTSPSSTLPERLFIRAAGHRVVRR